MINNIYTYDTYILLRSIYQILNLLFYSGHSSFYINAHTRKFWTGSVAIFKLFRVFSWSPLNQKLLTPSKVYKIEKKYWKKVSFRLHISDFSSEELMLFFNNFRSWLRIRFRDSAVSWMEVLDVAGVLYPLLFTHIC